MVWLIYCFLSAHRPAVAETTVNRPESVLAVGILALSDGPVPHCVGKLGFVPVDPAGTFENVLIMRRALGFVRRHIIAVSSFYRFFASYEYPSLASR